MNATVTPLSFLHADPIGVRGRRPVAHKRRLSPAGAELDGNLNTLGYFSAKVCVGTPATSFDLIVDTGSALTAFPCSDCPHCGEHQHATVPGARFDAARSSSSRKVECSHPPPGMHCRSCGGGGTCEYGVSYTEGSSIRGRLVEDNFWFGQSSSTDPRAVRATFGCQTYESGLFYSQVADGISGFSQADTYGPTLFDYLRRATGAPDVFSMCLAETHGALVLGATVPVSLGSSSLWIPYTGGGSYTIPLNDLKIADRSVGCSSSRYSSTIVDSGTTFMYLPPDAYRPVRDHFRTHCPWGTCGTRNAKGEYPDDYCYTMSPTEVDQLTPMSLHFANGVALALGPRQYTYELRRGVWCLGVFDNEHNGAVIGAANMRNHEVVFDRAHRHVAFIPSDCEGMHANRHSSVLTGGYALNGCIRSGHSTTTPPAAVVAKSPPPPSPSRPPLPATPSPSAPSPAPLLWSYSSLPSPWSPAHSLAPSPVPVSVRAPAQALAPVPVPTSAAAPALALAPVLSPAPLIERHITSALDPTYASLVEASAGNQDLVKGYAKLASKALGGH